MHIEIVTTKKKLSKSLINQMLQLSSVDLDKENVECLGYFINIVKDSHTSYLIKVNNEYRVLHGGWVKSGDSKSIYKRVRNRFTRTKEFESEKDRNRYYEFYMTCKQEAAQIYI